jgi:beta-RFAP synthase
MKHSLRITAPSRLHFGLLRLAQPAGRSYGGLGMMIDRPRVVVELSPAERWSASGPSAQQAQQFARRAFASCSAPPIRAVRIEVIEAPDPHTGLGSGTQLALAVAAGVRELCQAPARTIDELAASVDRGGRSAVGSHGFELGGLLWERGRLPHQTLGELQSRVEVPAAWRAVLATFPQLEGLSGEMESRAFERLPPVPTAITQRLARLAEEQILPTAENDDFDAFATAVYEYGHLAGSCFATVQGGPFASPRIAAAVQRLRAMGVSGVGQSSWGPTIYAFAPHEETALELIDRLESLEELADAQLNYSPPNNRGALLETGSSRTAVGYSKP